tara:strand:- start:26 stop:2035 length:2010 start_codon:yes stop_codon:yes gene_type:complete
MAIRTQLRLEQITGSLNDAVGSQAVVAATSLQGVLDQTAAAIKRIHGDSTFSANAAGVFKHNNTDFGGAGDAFRIADSAGDVTLKTLATDKDMIFNANDNGADSEVFRIDGSEKAILVAGANQLQFGDSATFMNQASDGNIGINADTGVKITAPSQELEASTAVVIDSPELQLQDDGVLMAFGDGGPVRIEHVSGDDSLRLAGPASPTLSFRDADLSVGSDSDGQLDLKADAEIELTAPIVEASATLRVAGNIISGSADKNLELQAAGSVAVVGDLQVKGNDIKSSTGATAITLSGTEVIVPGDLTVRGSTTTIDTTNLEVEDRLIGMNYGSGSAAAALGDAGLLIGNSGGTQRAWYYDVGDGRWAAVETNDAPDATTITPTGFLSIDVADVHLNGLDLYGDGANPAVTLTTGDSPDVGVQNNLTMGDDKSIVFGAGSDASIKYDEASSDKLQILAGGNGALMSVSAGDIVLGHSGLGAAALGDVMKIANVGGKGHVQVSGSITSFGAEGLVLSSSAGSELKHVSAADMMFLDVHKPASWSDADGVKLATNAASWTSFEAAFGEVSLLDAIVSAGGGAGTLQKRVVEVTGSAGYPTGYVVPLAADLDALSLAEVDERVDIFVNGQLLVSASEVAGNGDYALTEPRNGSSVGAIFQFDLADDDVVQAVVR